MAHIPECLLNGILCYVYRVNLKWLNFTTFLNVESLPSAPYLHPLFLQGNMDITDHKIVPAGAQLASDYESVSSENPPAKKAKDKNAVSNCLSLFNYPNNVSHKDV